MGRSRSRREGPRERPETVTYGVAIHTLDRAEGNGVAMLLVEAEDPAQAEHEARRIAEERFDCTVIAEHAVPWEQTVR